MGGGVAAHRASRGLEAVDFDRLLVQAETVVLVRHELLDLVTLVSLQLDHFAHSLGLGIANDGAIASCILVRNFAGCVVFIVTYRIPS